MAKRLRTTTAMSVHHPRISASILLLFVLAFATPAAAQSLLGMSSYTGGTGDMTNVGSAPLKLVASPTGYIRVPHLSADPAISAVYNYENNKDVYWGEATDAGNYRFRGRNLLVTNGRLGVGVNSPQYPLDVAGQMASNGFVLSNSYPGSGSDLTISAKFNTAAFDLISIHNGWDPNGVYIAGYNASNASVSGWTALATQKVYIGSSAFSNTNYLCVNLMNGGVGIGTSDVNDPNNRLFVETGIRTRKVTVDQAAWPDYVFNPGYKLMPLDSLNRFITNNHHLPEMPSADSVAKHGVELGDAQSKLLKKVEELTLYVLQQQKELEEVKAENKRLAAEMADLSQHN